MNRIKNEPYHGAAGYDAIARRKIKELEKKLGPQMVEKVVYQNDNAEFVDANGLFRHPISGQLDIVLGKTYRVELDGKAVEAEAKDAGESIPYIGNASLFEPAAPNTNENFLIVNMGAWSLLTTNPATSIKISTMEEKVEGGVFVITAESENHWDKTYAEILDAYNAGALPVLRVPGLASVFTLQDVNPFGAMAFVSLAYGGGSNIRVRKIELNADDQATYVEGFVGESPV